MTSFAIAPSLTAQLYPVARRRRALVVGAGINGVMSAWALAQAGWEVTLLERNRPLAQTSSASTKLLHGGLRYLEHGQIRLVAEALRERAWWIKQAPHLAHPIPILLPVYEGGRAPWVVRVGTALYDLLSSAHPIGPWAQWLAPEEALAMLPQLRRRGLRGAVRFTDGQMDDAALGAWALDRAREVGVQLMSGIDVHSLTTTGTIDTSIGHLRADVVVNAAGPWARHLLEASHLDSRYNLDLVRGSHLLLDGVIPVGALVEVPGSRRVVFTLPYQGHTLLGTTEVRQSIEEPIVPSPSEVDYLIEVYRANFDSEIPSIIGSFAGVRPLVRSHDDPSMATREYAIERQDRLINVFGGKWTTSRSLGADVARRAATLS